jgi:D-glycero-alpha-D-manno-heptose 1-phosphate guanylyltransferase
MITEAIVLAGGFGTRLRSVLKDVPKSLAPVAGKPFLGYLLDFAKKEGIEKFTFALGYKSEEIESFVKQYLAEGSYFFSIEDEPLGTGGAIHKACKMIASADTMVLNADTFFGVSFSQIAGIHEERKAACTLALKPMVEFDRYGSVIISNDMVVEGFSEKKYHARGLINGGVYALNAALFLRTSFPAVFSFEKDYLEKGYSGHQILGVIFDSYFIDIGIPDDYNRAQTELVSQVSHTEPAQNTIENASDV